MSHKIFIHLFVCANLSREMIGMDQARLMEDDVKRKKMEERTEVLFSMASRDDGCARLRWRESHNLVNKHKLVK